MFGEQLGDFLSGVESEIFKFFKYYLHLSPEADLDELLQQNIL